MQEPLIFDAHGKHAQSVLFCREHPLLLSAGMDARVHLWSLPGFERHSSFAGHANSVNTLSLSPDETRLATGSSDQTVRLWSFPAGEPLKTLEKQGSAVFSPDGGSLATIGSNGRVSLWDPDFTDPVVLPALDKRTFTLAFSPDGASLAIGGTGDIHRYDLGAQALAPSLAGHQHAVAKLLFSPDGRRLLATGAEGALSIWDTASWELERRIDLPARGVLQVALSPDGSQAFVSMDKLIAAYRLADGQMTREIPLPIKGVYGLDLSPDGSLLANAGADGKIRVWQLID